MRPKRLRFYDAEVSDEPAFSAKYNPSMTRGWVLLIIPLPRQLRAGRTVASAVANIEEALFAVRRAFECQMRSLDEIKQVFVPNSISTIRRRPARTLAKAGSFATNPFSR
jgi:hypothetical protein